MSERNDVITEAIAAVEKAQRDTCALWRETGHCAGYVERDLRCPECPTGDPHASVAALEELRR